MGRESLLLFTITVTLRVPYVRFLNLGLGFEFFSHSATDLVMH